VETTVTDGDVAVTVRVPDDGTVDTVRQTLAAAYDDAAVSTVWSGRATESGAVGDLPADLTDRQLAVLRHAFDVGYFERPRETNATDLADHFDIARATMTQHLRTAQRKLLAAFFEDR
jgi:predicted DNA binding protein